MLKVYQLSSGNRLEIVEDFDRRFPSLPLEGQFRWYCGLDLDRTQLKSLVEAGLIPEQARDHLESSPHVPVLMHTGPQEFFLLLHRVFYHYEDDRAELRPVFIHIGTYGIVTNLPVSLERTLLRVTRKVDAFPKPFFECRGLLIFCALLDAVLQDYFPILQKSRVALDEIEDEALRLSKTTAAHETIHKLLVVKKLASTFRTILQSHQLILADAADLIDAIAAENSWDAHNRQAPTVAIKSVLDHWTALLSEVDHLREHASSVFEVYSAGLMISMSISSAAQNSSMQRLNAITAIFLPLTFIVGVYGMNVPNMPEMGFSHFYAVLWAFMGGLTVVLIYLFKRWKWI